MNVEGRTHISPPNNKYPPTPLTPSPQKTNPHPSITPTNPPHTQRTQKTAFDDLIKRKMFVVSAFEIHGGVGGLFDLGPPSCALKASSRVWCGVVWFVCGGRRVVYIGARLKFGRSVWYGVRFFTHKQSV